MHCEMKDMKNAKTGLRMLSASIIIGAAWLVILFILILAVKDFNAAVVGALITGIVNLVCYIIELIGLFKAGKDNERFHLAGKLKIFNIVLAVISIILAAVANAVSTNTAAVNALSITITVISTISLLFEVIVLVNIVKGSKEISPRVTGLANFVLITFLIQVVFTVLTYVFQAIGNETMNNIAGAFSVIALIAVIVFAICYLVLIFRATANVGKKRG